MALLLADCLTEILENLENDKTALASCLLVNRLWCKISVRILWRDIWSFKCSSDKKLSQMRLAILSTLVACLPNESKELLHENEIFISTPTSKPPLFDYAAFCRVLSVDDISQMVNHAFENNSPIASLVLKEIIKMFVDQIHSLKKLTYELGRRGVPHIGVLDTI